MAPLTQDVPLRFLGPVYSEVFNLSLDLYPISIYKGAPVIVDQDVDATAVVPADNVTMASGDVFVGIAAEHRTSELGQDEPTELECYVWPTIVGFPSTALEFTDLGKAVSMSDSGTLTETGGAYPRIGTLYTIRDGYLYVLLDPPTARA
jgi:hypothetical protein